MADHEQRDELKVCIETVRRLEEENERLREAAGAFGQLAERLNHTLQEERRIGAERRDSSRVTQDRRASSN